MSSTYEMYLNFKLPLETFPKNICHIKDKVNETFVLTVTKPSQTFWNMEYSALWNISQYGIFCHIVNYFFLNLLAIF